MSVTVDDGVESIDDLLHPLEIVPSIVALVSPPSTPSPR